MTPTGSRRWPSLTSLFSGYLHQDFTAEHGSAANAVRARLTEMPADEAVELSAEWRRFLNVTSGTELGTRARLLRELAGGSWAPASEQEFELVSVLLMDAART